MGYDVHQFVEAIDINLVCSICGLVLENPVLTPCGHSFCFLCLETWLRTSMETENEQEQRQPSLHLHYRRPTALPSTGRQVLSASCPECRKPVQPKEAIPEITLRNLINGYYMFCTFKNNGCYVMTKLEHLKNHESICPHSPIECASCKTTVRMVNLAEHQIKCQGLAALIEDSDDCYERQEYTASKLSMSDEDTTNAECAQLLQTMQEQMSSLTKDLEDIGDIPQGSKYHRKARNINKQRIKPLPDNGSIISEQKSSRKAIIGQSDNIEQCDWSGLNWFENSVVKDINQNYLSLTTPRIPATRVATFIFRYLLDKPSYIDNRQVFRAVQRFYDDFTTSSRLYDSSLHILLATALASNWFTEIQHKCLGQWEISLGKCKELLESTIHVNLNN
ncbi:E3 ubiquitin-protein ligase NRDP1-like [Argonauta hians]